MRGEHDTTLQRPQDPPLDELAALRLLVGNSTDLLSRHAPDGTYRYASPAAKRLLGYDPEELVGRSAHDLFHPDDLPTVEDSHDTILLTPTTTTIRYRIRHKAGHWVWFETSSNTIRDPGTDDVIEIQATSRDISRRMEVAARLRESEERFRLAMSNAPVGMALVGLDGSFLAVNKTLCEIVGRSADELTTTTFMAITHPDDVTTELPLAQKLRTGDLPRYAIEKRYLHPDGHEVWIQLNRTLVRDDNGEPLYFISQVQDISERREQHAQLERMNEELLTSNAELEWFASMASHDLRSPLVAVQGILDLLLTGEEDQLPDSAAKWLRRAQSQCSRLLDNVEALLRMSRVGRSELVIEDVDLGELLAEVMTDLASVITDAVADVVADPLPVIRADRAQMRLLFQNLIANSVKYRDPERPLTVQIATEQRDTDWVITVEDNGRGFDAVDREAIFELFARGSDGQKLEGSGIGLATCRRIVERHAGTIEADPVPDHGAKFTITLPR
jgi:PAS domain S-box-containing protein